MINRKLLGLPALLLSAGFLTACMNDDKNPVVEQPVASGCLEEGGKLLKLNITDDLCELEAGEYSLQGVTFVQNGSVLKLHPGVTIKGKPDGSQSALVVVKGGILHAVGTPAQPIVFTAGTESPVRGDFGGVVLLGNSQVNSTTGTADIEGLVGVPYGGGSFLNTADSSGHLQYVRIEYAGYLFGEANELNGLTLGGVGSRTVLSHIHQYEGLDDCFEWFGGTVSASYLVATGCDDDIFDYDFGWQGTLQFLLGAHNGPATSSDPNGIEADGRSGSEEAHPRTYGTIANMTLIGNGTTSQSGMRLRRGVGGQIYNSIITGFGKGSAGGWAARVEGNTSIRLATKDSLAGYGLYAFNNGTAGTYTVSPAAGLPDSVNTRQAALEAISGWFVDTIPALAPITLTNPKPASSLAGAAAIPAGGKLVPTNYIGAFDPAAASLWIDEGQWVRKTNW